MAKLSFDLDAAKAAFLAKGGLVESVPQGQRAIASDKTIFAAMREGTRAKSDAIREERESYAAWERGVQDSYLRATGVHD